MAVKDKDGKEVYLHFNHGSIKEPSDIYTGNVWAEYEDGTPVTEEGMSWILATHGHEIWVDVYSGMIDAAYERTSDR